MLNKLFFVLKYFKKDKIFLLILSLVSISLLEVIGVGIIIPFITILLSDSLITDFNFYFLNSFFENKSQSELILLIITFMVIFFSIKSTYIIYIFKKIYKYVSKFSSLIRDELFQSYIYDDYQNFTKKDQSKLVANISNVTFDFSNNFLSSILIFLSEILIIMSIFIFMLFYNFWLSFILILVILILGSLYFKVISPKLKTFGSTRLNSEENVIKYCKLGFQNIKELKIFSKEKFFLKIFKENTKNSEISNFFYNFSAQFPRIGIELFAVLGISTLIFCMVLFEYENKEILSVLSFFGVAIFRVIPSINRLMFSFQTTRYHKKTLEIIYDELKKVNITAVNPVKKNTKPMFNISLNINRVSFGYNEENPILDEVNLTIKKGELVGISGESGSGKSTLLDILTGLIKPAKGEILVDGKKLESDSWQNICGYVSQNLFFYNDTLAKNIAFGEPEENIDYNKIKSCINISQLNDFVKKNPQGVRTIIGENAIKMSGGQRQRLAIARALYRNPEILILDEATNALDETLQLNIVQALKNFKPQMTIVLVSHDKKLINLCSNIFELKSKKIKQNI